MGEDCSYIGEWSCESKQILLERNYTIMPLIAIQAVDSIRLKILDCLLSFDNLKIDVLGRVHNLPFYNLCESVYLLDKRIFNKLEREICWPACSVVNRKKCDKDKCENHLSEHSPGVLRVKPNQPIYTERLTPSFAEFGPCFEYVLNLGNENVEFQVQTNNLQQDHSFAKIQVVVQPGSMIVFRSGTSLIQNKFSTMQLEGLVQPMAITSLLFEENQRWDSVMGGIASLETDEQFISRIRRF